MLICGSNARSDSIDVLNYDVDLNLLKFMDHEIVASCEVTFTALEDGIEAIPLDLEALTIDSITMNGTPLDYDYDQLLIHVHLPQAVNIGDTAAVTVYYQGEPTPDPDWGGFNFQNGIAYNLGIGLSSNPYNIGRSWHPCFDNFVERATYDISIVSHGGRKGYAVGEFLGEETIAGDTIRRSYRMDLPLPTYLVGSATSNYVEINDMHVGQYGEYPILLVARPGDVGDYNENFLHLSECIDAFESWFGPYRWGQVGYVSTPVGAMEHATLIAYPYTSLQGANLFQNERLMAHEFGHHWWGNVTTLSCPENMWIKEGNAEYSAHLFTEFTYGKNDFVKQVKDNHYYVLDQVHRVDGEFLTLSGIPYEHTYSRHTYRKGASVMHNLRGYLGDTLFQKGMTAVLNDYEFAAVDALEMQEKLTEATGVDMNHFFNAWLYQPGFASYEIDSTHVQPTAGEWEVTLYIQQKLREAFSFHENVPLEVTFFDENWNEHHAQVMVSGEFSEPTAMVPFEPVWQVLNDRNKLNIARMQDRKVAYEADDLNLGWSDVSNFEVLTTSDSAMVSLIHHWVAPDADPTQTDVQLSSRHYWTLGGILPDDFTAKCLLPLDGGNEFDLDYDLLSVSDSIIVVWRPNAATPWGEYPFYEDLSNFGFMRIEEMLPGDYAFAVGEIPLATSVTDVEPTAFLMKTYPNPTTHSLTVQGLLPLEMPTQLNISDATGRVVHAQQLPAQGREFSENVNVSDLPDGMYWLEVRSEGGDFQRVEKFVKSQ